MQSSRPTYEGFSRLFDPQSRDQIRIGIIGFGAHIKKNILPCFTTNRGRQIAGIYVRDARKYRSLYPELANLFTDNRAQFLADESINVVYIASPISTHFAHAQAALLAGRHVWCEKPLTDSLENSMSLVALAQKTGQFLAEVSMYRYHRQFKMIRTEIIKRQATGERILGVSSRFSIPALNPDNIRYSKELGGGALLDIGYYPLSATTALFGAPLTVAANGYFCPAHEVDLSGQALLEYAGFSCCNFWAIGSSYSNQIEVNFSDSTLRVERAFSKSADLETRITDYNASGKVQQIIPVPADDHFEAMFRSFETKMVLIDPAGWTTISQDCLATAKVLDQVGTLVRSANL